MAIKLCEVSQKLLSFGPAVIGAALISYEPHLRPFVGSLFPLWRSLGVCVRIGFIVADLIQIWTFSFLSFNFSRNIVQILAGSVINIIWNLVRIARYFYARYVKNITKARFITSYRTANSIRFGETRLHESITEYITLQILISHINICYRSVALPAALVLYISSSIMGTWSTISLKYKLFQHFGNAIFPFFSFTSSVFILTLTTLAGMLNKKSTKCVSKFGKLVGNFNYSEEQTGRKCLSRQVRSCSSLRIRFQSNFVEMKTPLVMTLFCIKSTVRLLLIN